MPHGSTKEETLERAIQMGLPKKAAEARMNMNTPEQFEVEIDVLAKAGKSLGGKEAATKFLELGHEGLEKFVKRMSSQKGVPPIARKHEGDVVLADLCWNNMKTTQGVAWVVVMEGSKVLSKTDLLVIYNGKLKGPVAKLPKAKSKGSVKLHTFGLGMVLGENEWATFGLLPPKGRAFSKWGPCYFEGDPERKSNLTSVKRLADSMNVDDGVAEVMDKLGYEKRPGGGVPISFLKRAVNDTMKLSGYASKPSWVSCSITTASTEEDIEMLGNPAMEERLKRFWFADDEDENEEQEEEEGNSIWD